MKLIIFIISIFFSIVTYGQNKHLTIGHKDKGICFGNSKTNFGLRFNFRDRNVDKLSGINISGISQSKVSNGLTFALIVNYDSINNGIIIDGLGGSSYRANGLMVSGLGHNVNHFNGVAIGGLAIPGDTLNGLFLSIIGIGYWNTERVKLVNGVAVGIIIGSDTEKMNGLSLGIFHNVCDTLRGVSVALMNRTKELHGLQIGLWNVAENNRVFKRMPFLNFNFRRRPSR